MDAPLPGFFDEEPTSPPSKPTRTTIAQTEIARLKQEVAQLRKELAARSEPPTSDPATLPESLLKDYNFLADMARFSENLASEASIRKKYNFTQETWERLGSDDELFMAIENEKLRRIRDGSAKREKAQQLVVKAPDILNGIMVDPKASPKHKIDSAKVLDAFAANGPTAAPELERFVISITLSADEKLVIGGPVRPSPTNGVTVIDTTATDLATIAERENDGPL
jgi:hypothetical protein